MTAVIPARMGRKSEAKVDITFNPNESLKLVIQPAGRGMFLLSAAFGDVEPDVFRIDCVGNRDVDPHTIVVGETELLWPVEFGGAYVSPDDPLAFIVTNLSSSPQRFECVFHFAIDVRAAAERVQRRRLV